MPASVYNPFMHNNHQKPIKPPKATANYGVRKNDKRRRRKFFGE